MNKDSIFQILSDIIECHKEDLTTLSKDQNLSDLGLDSIRFIQFIVAVEEAFHIEINDSDLLFSKFETIEKLFSTLEKYFANIPLKKVLVCDCDNVLWRGVAGEEETHIDSNTSKLQKAIVDLYHHGVLICICSKNEKANIDFAFNSSEMVLKKEHITISKINFNDKATSIKEISNELNLSLDSFVFLDDSDYELGLITALLPEVCVIKADYNDLTFIQDLSDLFAQNTSSINRTKLYKEQKEREKEKIRFKTVEEYNNSLETKVTFCYADIASARRIAELTQRTNQFNLSGSRYTEQEILNMINDKSFCILTLSVSDKYGDMGIVGAVICEKRENLIILHSFYLSCRAFGRGFEYLMLGEIKKLGEHICGVYNETEKNYKHKSFYEDNGVSLYEL